MLTAQTRIRVKEPQPLPRQLTGDTKIRLSQIKDLADWTRDRVYQNGDISEKTGLMRVAPGKWVEPGAESLKEKDWKVPRSLGARAVTYKVTAPFNVRGKGGKNYKLVEGSEIKEIELIARGHGIRKVRKLIKKYFNDKKPTVATDWTKKKGYGTVEDEHNKKREAELHWYECKGKEKVEFKVKRWKDEK